MNTIDAVILAITAISALFGLWCGLIKEVLSLLTWVAALLVARIYSAPLAGAMTNLIESEGVRYVTAFAIIFIVVMMAGTALNHLMAKVLTVSGLRMLDRLLGSVFGVARGVIIVLVLLFIASPFVAETTPWQQSRLIPYGMTMVERSRLFFADAYNNDAFPMPGSTQPAE